MIYCMADALITFLLPYGKFHFSYSVSFQNPMCVSFRPTKYIEGVFFFIKYLQCCYTKLHLLAFLPCVCCHIGVFLFTLDIRQWVIAWNHRNQSTWWCTCFWPELPGQTKHVPIQTWPLLNSAPSGQKGQWVPLTRRPSGTVWKQSECTPAMLLFNLNQGILQQISGSTGEISVHQHHVLQLSVCGRSGFREIESRCWGQKNLQNRFE